MSVPPLPVGHTHANATVPTRASRTSFRTSALSVETDLSPKVRSRLLNVILFAVTQRAQAGGLFRHLSRTERVCCGAPTPDSCSARLCPVPAGPARDGTSQAQFAAPENISGKESPAVPNRRRTQRPSSDRCGRCDLPRGMRPRRRLLRPHKRGRPAWRAPSTLRPAR